MYRASLGGFLPTLSASQLDDAFGCPDEARGLCPWHSLTEVELRQIID